MTNSHVREVFLKREKLIASLRTSLEERGYVEVETPMMQPIHGGALARPFRTHHNTLDVDLFLRIAPELYLKRLVVGGMDRVYEINRNFRNEGISSQHNPEFTMLEFYQAYSDYRDLMDLSEELLRNTAAAVNGGNARIEFEGHQIDFSSLRRISLKEAIAEYWPDEGTRPSVGQLDDPERVKELVGIYNRKAESPLKLTGYGIAGRLSAGLV